MHQTCCTSSFQSLAQAPCSSTCLVQSFKEGHACEHALLTMSKLQSVRNGAEISHTLYFLMLIRPHFRLDVKMSFSTLFVHLHLNLRMLLGGQWLKNWIKWEWKCHTPTSAAASAGLYSITVINNYKWTSYPGVGRQWGKELELTMGVYICPGIW